MSWIKVQLRNQNTVSIPLDQYLTMTDQEWDDLMNSEYGYYVDNPFNDDISTKNIVIDEEETFDMDEDEEEK